jgi:hypothetical protein
MEKRTKSYGAKRDRILEVLSTDPGKSDREIAKAAKCSVSYVKLLRDREYASELRVLEGEGLVEKPTPEAQGVDAILEERGKRYGNFITHAAITQQLKEVTQKHLYHRGKVLAADQQEALDMIFHKIGRIINGDPDYADSWVDIAGYAKLVADRLEGKVR